MSSMSVRKKDVELFMYFIKNSEKKKIFPQTRMLYADEQTYRYIKTYYYSQEIYYTCIKWIEGKCNIYSCCFAHFHLPLLTNIPCPIYVNLLHKMYTGQLKENLTQLLIHHFGTCNQYHY